MDPQEKDARRMIAAELSEQGELRDGQIAALLEVTTRAVSKWHKAFGEGGRQALRSSGPPGLPDARRVPAVPASAAAACQGLRVATGNWTWGSRILK